MELKLAVDCDDAHERPDGKIDIHGVFSELTAPGFPAMQERLTVVFVIEWSDEEVGEQPLRADLVDDQRQRVLTIQGHTDVLAATDEGARPQTRLIMPLEKIVFPHAGRYHFDLVAGGDSARACSLYVGEHRDR
jgi:hypothetical protein